jgi:hypothetical protein
MTTPEQLLETWQPHFRAAYERDPQNAARQSFDDYWHWVHVFFISGGAGVPGWFAQIEDLLRTIPDKAQRDQLRARLEQLGIVIASEWAKDARTRRIYSTWWQGRPNLQDWGKRLLAAASQPDSAALAHELDAIEHEAGAAAG